MSTVTKFRPKQALRLHCAACGAQADAACDCGVGYLSAGEFAKKVVAENPDLSNRSIAEKTGLSLDTVNRARRGERNRSPENEPQTRTGLDGKQHPAKRNLRRGSPEWEARKLAAERSRAPANPAGVTVTIDEIWRAPLARMAEYLGVPADEYANFLMYLGGLVFGKFQKGLSNDIAWWLIEMHSKYSDTFNVSSWEGSCGHLAIDRLYAERNVPVGKYQEWKAAGSPGMSKEEQERLQKALAVIRKRAKRQGLKLEVKSGAVTTYWLTNDGGTGAGGSIEAVGKILDRVEAGLPIVDWEAVVAANG
jgi:hypothetical protein